MMNKVTSWGRIEQPLHDLSTPVDRQAVGQLLTESAPGLAYGLGRSYGDVCLNAGGNLWNTSNLDRFVSFDIDTGVLVCEAGVSLKSIQSLAVKSGWMLPVSPGTQFVTVAGAIANDVHGKNHHRMGCFGNHVKSFELLRTDGECLTCSAEQNADWFAATIGGFGLTGVILTVELQLRSVDGPWLQVESLPYYNLEGFFDIALESESDWEYTVSWIDCCSADGRGIFTRCNHSQSVENEPKPGTQINVPFTPPISLINRWSLKAFNKCYFNFHKAKAGHSLQHYRPLFYPLDAIGNWNRIYGRNGFYQYQCVIPEGNGRDAIKEISQKILSADQGSFLAVLKTFGDCDSPGMMSFPMRGVTLALDFPNQGAKTLALFETLDAVVREAGGRLYLAKDNRMSSDMFEATYPNLDKFCGFIDPGISSSMSRRLLGR